VVAVALVPSFIVLGIDFNGFQTERLWGWYPLAAAGFLWLFSLLFLYLLQYIIVQGLGFGYEPLPDALLYAQTIAALPSGVRHVDVNTIGLSHFKPIMWLHRSFAHNALLAERTCWDSIAHWLAKLDTPEYTASQPSADLEIPSADPTRPGTILVPMTASDAPLPFESSDWTYEIKFHGWRAIAVISNGRLQLLLRNGRDFTGRFPELTSIVSSVSGDAVLDGEVIAADGTPESLRKLLTRGVQRTFVAFDLLEVSGRLIIGEPIEVRRAKLAAMVAESDRVLLSRAHDDGRALFQVAVSRGYEGIVAKRARSLYRPGTRTADWITINSDDTPARSDI
jgi:hypothetical protein